jgi:hypothetical protein
VLLNWDDKSAEALIHTSSRSTSKVHITGWSKNLEITAGGEGIVSHAGLALLRQLADKTGLTGGLSRALATPRLLIHDRGRDQRTAATLRVTRLYSRQRSGRGVSPVSQ